MRSNIIIRNLADQLRMAATQQQQVDDDLADPELPQQCQQARLTLEALMAKKARCAEETREGVERYKVWRRSMSESKQQIEVSRDALISGIHDDTQGEIEQLWLWDRAQREDFGLYGKTMKRMRSAINIAIDVTEQRLNQTQGVASLSTIDDAQQILNEELPSLPKGREALFVTNDLHKGERLAGRVIII